MSHEALALENFRSAFHKDTEHSDPLINRIMEPANKVFDYLNKKDLANILSAELPKIEFSGFEQEAPHKSDGVVSDLIHGIKHFFGKDDSIKDRLREKVESQMNPEEKKKFQAENKALDKYERDLLAWQTQMTINPGPLPEKPSIPMHNEIERRVKSIELDLSEKVREKMSPEDRKRLYAQYDKYEKDLSESRRIHNPLGTGELFKRAPEPGNAIRDYFDRIKEESERYLSQ